MIYGRIYYMFGFSFERHQQANVLLTSCAYCVHGIDGVIFTIFK